MFRSTPARIFEQLESRSLLNGHPLSRLEAIVSHRLDDVAALVSSRLEGISSAAATTLSATLTDANDSSVTGTAKFTSYTHDGTTTTTFSASVKGAAADTAYTVDIDGTPVGTITTDANGSGKLSLTGSLAVSVAVGDTVNIGTPDANLVTGSLATSVNVGCHGGDDNADITRLSASLSDSTGVSAATGTVKFTSYTDTDSGDVETKLAVSVKGADADTTFNIVIDGTQVGTLTTDANGNGSMVLKGGLTVTPAANSTVAIVNSTTGTTTIGGTLDVSTGYSGGFNFGFARRR